MQPRPSRPKLVPLLVAGALAALLALPAVASDAPGPRVQTAPDGALVVPLVGAPPAWWTAEVREQAILAGQQGLGYDFALQTAAVVPTGGYPSALFLRPGMQIFPDSVFPGWCTAAFAFGPRSVGYDKISTAGHCTETVGDDVFALAAPTLVVHFGATSSTTGNGGVGNDWALIDVFPTWEPFVDADVAVIGGPCGRVTTNDYWALPSQSVNHYGWGFGETGTTFGTPRGGHLEALYPTYAVFWTRNAGGDSGSPVTLQDNSPSCLTGGRALVILTHGDLHCPLDTCNAYGTRITLVPGTMGNGDLLPLDAL